MILRTMTLVAGLLGASVASQLPEFTQQYAQRLGGAVDALSEVVADFDASAAASGLSREEALSELSGSDFLARRRLDMERSIVRLQRLGAAQQLLLDAGPMQRSLVVMAAHDHEVLARSWQNYSPAVPLTAQSAGFGGAGFVLSAAVWAFLSAVLRRFWGLSLRKNRKNVA